MIYLTIISTFLALPFVSAGILHTDHPHEVLDNIHSTPHCAYTCIFDEGYQSRWAPECDGLQPGQELGSCYCRANAYQYIVDQCVDRKCGAKGRKTVFLSSMTLTLGERDE
jgi:hypothetical protein